MSSPVQGVRVPDLTRLLPGSYPAYLMAALGAEVIQIEDPLAERGFTDAEFSALLHDNVVAESGACA